MALKSVRRAVITSHREYGKLGRDAESRQKAYRQLFRGRLAEKDLNEIRDCTNKSWVLGDECFKVKVAAKTGIPSQRVGREVTGSQRNTEKANINDSDPNATTLRHLTIVCVWLLYPFNRPLAQ